MLKENQISDLINKSGRLRMLSHRASMLLTQISAGVTDAWFIEELAISIDKFEKGYLHIQHTLDTEPVTLERFTQLVAKKRSSELSIKEIIAEFLFDIKRYQSQIRSKTLDKPQELSRFLKYVATDLLVALNTIVAFFEGMLNDIANNKSKNINQLAKEVEDSIDEVDQINLSIKILSFNASVEAARAGEVGKGFAVVSKEMNSLSSNTRRVTQNIKDTINSFVDELNA